MMRAIHARIADLFAAEDAARMAYLDAATGVRPGPRERRPAKRSPRTGGKRLRRPCPTCGRTTRGVLCRGCA